MEQKIKQDLRIGENIRRIRKNRKLGQTDLVRMLQIDGCDMTRECLAKIERCTQHIQATQLLDHLEFNGQMRHLYLQTRCLVVYYIPSLSGGIRSIFIVLEIEKWI